MTRFSALLLLAGCDAFPLLDGDTDPTLPQTIPPTTTVPISSKGTTTTLCPTHDYSLSPPPGGYVMPNSWETAGLRIDLLDHPDGFGADVMGVRDILLAPAVLDIDLSGLGCHVENVVVIIDEAACPGDCTVVDVIGNGMLLYTGQSLSNGLVGVAHHEPDGIDRVRVTASDAVVGPIRVN